MEKLQSGQIINYDGRLVEVVKDGDVLEVQSLSNEKLRAYMQRMGQTAELAVEVGA